MNQEENQPENATDSSARLKVLADQLKMPDSVATKPKKLGVALLLIVLTLLSVAVIYWKSSLFQSQTQVEIARVETIQFGPVATAHLRSTGNTLYPTRVQINVTTVEPLRKKWVEEGDQVTKNQLLLEFEDEDLLIEEERVMVELEKLQFEYANHAKKVEMGTLPISELTELEFEIQSLEIERKKLQNKRSDLTYHAPFDGIITQVMIEESEIANGAVLEVVKTSEIWVETEIRQEEIFNLNVGDPVMVMFEAIPMMEFAGRIRTISPDADEAMGSVKLILELLKPDPEIRSGYTSRIFFTKETVLSNRVTTLAPGLPKESVYCLDLESDEWKSSVHFDFESQLTCKVWVSENGLAKSINVTTGMVSGNWIEIKEGVVVGDDVIYSESVSFSDGLHIAE